MTGIGTTTMSIATYPIPLIEEMTMIVTTTVAITIAARIMTTIIGTILMVATRE